MLRTQRQLLHLLLWVMPLLLAVVVTGAIADRSNHGDRVFAHNKTLTRNDHPLRHSVVARRADSFVDSICVTTHWSYTDTPYYQRYREVKQKLIEAGIRHVRDALYQDRAQDLGRSGIRMTAVTDIPNYTNGNEDTVRSLVKQIQAANATGARIGAVEGPNEPDLFWDASRFNKKYKGQGFPAGVMAFQKDL
jgi:hypothetical protein